MPTGKPHQRPRAPHEQTGIQHEMDGRGSWRYVHRIEEPLWRRCRWETEQRLTHEHESSDVEDGAGSEHQMTDDDEAVYTGQLSVWGVHTSDSRRAKLTEATNGGRASAEAADDLWRFEFVGEGLCVFGDGSRCERVDVEGEGERVRSMGSHLCYNGGDKKRERKRHH